MQYRQKVGLLDHADGNIVEAVDFEANNVCRAPVSDHHFHRVFEHFRRRRIVIVGICLFFFVVVVVKVANFNVLVEVGQGHKQIARVGNQSEMDVVVETLLKYFKMNRYLLKVQIIAYFK